MRHFNAFSIAFRISIVADNESTFFFFMFHLLVYKQKKG